MARLARVYARKREFPMADSLFRAALANQRRYVPDTHYDMRTIFGFMSERYRLERKPRRGGAIRPDGAGALGRAPLSRGMSGLSRVRAV